MYIPGMPLPSGATILGYACHPRDRAGALHEGAVVLLASGRLVLMHGDATMRSLPQSDPAGLPGWRPVTAPWTGRALVAAREAAGLTQYGLAARLRDEPGCETTSANTVRANEGIPGKPPRPPNATLLAAYARALGVTTDYLCSEPAS